MTLYLSRVELRQDPGVQALTALIDPDDRARALDAHHRLIWSLFADDPDRRRDFLWRVEGRGRFMVLSQRRPAPAPLFEEPQVKEFEPALANGDALDFALRVNATRSLPAPKGQRGKRTDVVMHLLHGVSGDRADQRMALAQQAAQDWMAGQGARAGFAPDRIDVQDYSVMALPGHQGQRKGQPQFGILDLSGRISVTDPDAFLPALAQGFGRAKAFGCGLMMIRRAR